MASGRILYKQVHMHTQLNFDEDKNAHEWGRNGIIKNHRTTSYSYWGKIDCKNHTQISS